jgi:large subunit ribosomal protein L18e
MVKSKTKIQKQTLKKTNLNLVDTINSSKKYDAWLSVARTLSGTRRNKVGLNLKEIEKRSEESKIVVIPGKVLASGEIKKKLKIVALDFSKQTKEKILNAGATYSTILEEIKLNPEGTDIQILK